jgi:predicted transcriptional regulator of viral defense system
VAVVRRDPSDSRTKADADRVRQLAERQHGVISRRQLLECGLSGTRIARWLEAGWLHRVHPHVYAVAHSALSLDGRLNAALRYGGDRAAFSHTTAAWIWSLTEAQPSHIHLTVSGRRRSLPAVRIHHSRGIDRATCDELPVTSLARTLVDIAAMLSPRQLRRALSEADYRGLLELGDLEEALRRGRVGSRH